MNDDERKALIAWMLDRVGNMDHECLAGDCPHGLAFECVAALLAAFLEDTGEE